MSETMRILGMSRLCLLYIGLGSQSYVPIFGYNVPRALIRLFVILAQISFATLQFLVGREKCNEGLYAILFPMHLMVLFTMKALIYGVLIVKTNRITELIDYLQEVVTTRTYYQRN